jgi:hypothetical protein
MQNPFELQLAVRHACRLKSAWLPCKNTEVETRARKGGSCTLKVESGVKPQA